MAREQATETVSLWHRLNLIATPDRSPMDDDECCCDQLLSIEACFPLSNLCIQRDEGELTHKPIDPEESLLNIASVQIPVEEFQEFEANARIPATVCHSAYGWLRTACEPVYLFSTHEPFALICADIDIHYLGNHTENSTNRSLSFGGRAHEH